MSFLFVLWALVSYSSLTQENHTPAAVQGSLHLFTFSVLLAQSHICLRKLANFFPHFRLYYRGGPFAGNGYDSRFRFIFTKSFLNLFGLFFLNGKYYVGICLDHYLMI